ncbi:MAG: putative fluoride ion transporter CrcB [Phycisphaerae bacterium]|nr:putative fluoride ion transporter CrcB [Phycisphaerae bacterium]
MIQILWVALGGAVGSVLRYGVTALSKVLFEGRFPIGTLTVNLVGCLLIGLLTPLMLNKGLVSPNVRLLVLVGVLGGLTTFSTFGYETFMFINDGQWARAGWNIALNNVLGIALVLVGYRIAERVFGA